MLNHVLICVIFRVINKPQLLNEEPRKKHEDSGRGRQYTVIFFDQLFSEFDLDYLVTACCFKACLIFKIYLTTMEEFPVKFTDIRADLRH
jgi:hypothetical protein